MKNKVLLLLVILVVGFIIPFVPYVHIIEMFYLLIPFAITILISFIYLLISFFDKEKNSVEIAFKVALLPLFISAQLFSGFSVDKIQRIRSEKIINEIETKKSQLNQYPEKFDTNYGIHYLKSAKSDNFQISYERGFFVTEKYFSETKEWKSFGWHD